MSDNINKKEKLWVITELYYPEETSTGYYLTKIAEGVIDNFDVNVICGQPNYSARGITAATFERHKGVNIHRAFGTRLNKNVIPYRLINMLTLSMSIFFKSLFKFCRNDKVLVVTTPPLLPFITGIASLLKGSKHILLIHDNYPEILIAVDKAKKNSLFTKTLNFLNRWLYKKAHRLIVVGRDMQQLVSKKMRGNDTGKIDVIPNWAELETVSPSPREENLLLEELELKEKLVFLYAGNMGYPNDIDSFVNVAEKLKNDNRFHFVFLGAGVKKVHLDSTVKSKKLKNITILKPKPRSEQQIFLNACDVAIVSLVKKMWGVSMPSRTYNILAAGKPILALCEKDSEIELVLKDDEVGWSLLPNNPELLLEKIEDIYRNRSSLDEMGIRARNSALKRYSLETALEMYKKVLHK